MSLTLSTQKLLNVSGQTVTNRGLKKKKLVNSFLNIYLRIIYSSFPPKIVTNGNNDNKNWIILGINTSCIQKRELYIAYISSNNLELKGHYPLYYKIQSNVFKEAKKCVIIKKILNQVINVLPLGI
jgi:hypothetical protein